MKQYEVIKIVKGLLGKISWGNFGKNLFFAFIVFQVISVLLSQFFPIFKEWTSKFALGWLIIIFGLIVFLVLRLVLGMKTFDKKSVFILLISIGILLFIVIYFELDFGQLFDMSIVKNDLTSIGRYLGSLVR